MLATQQPEIYKFPRSIAADAIQPATHLHLLQLTVETLLGQRLNVSADRIHGAVRGTQRIVFARHLAFYLLHHVGALSYAETGAVLGRDRRTAAFAIGRIEARREDDPAFDRTVELLVADVRRATETSVARWHLGLG